MLSSKMFPLSLGNSDAKIKNGMKKALLLQDLF